MNSKTLIIFEYRILFEILNEIRESLNFKIIQCDENEYNNIQFDIHPEDTNVYKRGLLISSKN